ncbi:tRNA-dependent cyclodipeptide synthase [Streptomyces sp. NPDC051567]|uniref:tRNA-dependent cyclodipeptide synthase n=1 Tax=Streptomyces sp. NPDC051567 TaxID=3365660 RepID=UPI0037AD0C0F
MTAARGRTRAGYGLRPVLPGPDTVPTTVLIGASPFNKVYSPARLREHVTWSVSQGLRVHVLFAGVEAAYRLIDAGDSPRRAVRRAVRATHEMRDACRTALAEAGDEDPDAYLHVWTKLEEHARYRELRDLATAAYRDRPEFRTAVHDELVGALRTSLNREPTLAELENSAPYILAEVPLFVDAPAILGTDSVMFLYHREPPIFLALHQGIVPGLAPSPGMGLGVLTLPAAPATAAGTAPAGTGRDALPDILDWPVRPGPHGTAPPVFARLRASSRAHRLRMPSGDLFWIFVRREDIVRVTTDRRFSRNLTGRDVPRFGPAEDFQSLPGALFNTDAPRHTRIRRVLDPCFGPAQAEEARGWLTALAGDLLERMADGPNPADLVASYAVPLALRAACRAQGIPGELQERHLDGLRARGGLTTGPAGTNALPLTVGLARDCLDAADPAASHPAAVLARARADGTLTDEEAVGTMAHLIVTGTGPVVGPVPVMALTLLRHPRELDLLRREPGRWPAAVDELLRHHHNGPMSLPRLATENVQVGDVLVRAGEAVLTPYLAALREPDHCERAAEFDIRREPDALNLTFGAGPHSCPGASFARVYLQVALRGLFDRMPRLGLACRPEDLPWNDPEDLFTRPRKLPVTW